MQKILAAIKGGKEFKNIDGTMPNAYVNIPYHSIDINFPPRLIDYPIAPDDALFDELVKRKGFTTYVIFDADGLSQTDLLSSEFPEKAYNMMKSYFRIYIVETTFTFQILKYGS